MRYKTSLDSLAKIITIGVIVLFIFISQQNISAIINAKGDTAVILTNAATLLLLFLILLISWLFAPQSYTIDQKIFSVNRVFGSVDIQLSDIEKVRLLTDNDMKGTIRTFGVGGLFGYYGKFYTPVIGATTFYTTQRENRILIATKQGKRIVITPDDMTLLEKIIKDV